MMGKYAVCMLATNLYFFENMIKNLSEQNNDLLFVIALDKRVADIEHEVKKLIRQNNKHHINFKVLKDEVVTNYLFENLSLTKNGMKFVKEYTMGMNINTYYYLFDKYKFDKIFFVDDDVLINKNLDAIFALNDYSFQKNFMSSGKYDEGKPNMNAWLDFSGLSFKTWASFNCYGGHKLYIYDKKHVKIYGDLLCKFYNNDVFRNNWEYYIATGKQKTKAWFMDQYFDNSFIHIIGKANDNLKGYVRTILSYKYPIKNKNKYLDCVLTHYACGKMKIKFLDDLRMEGILNV